MDHPAGEHLTHILAELSTTIDELLKENQQLRAQLAAAGKETVPFRKKNTIDGPLTKLLFKKERKSAALWTLKSTHTQHKDGIWSIHCSPLERNMLISASADQTVTVWDVSKPIGKNILAIYSGHRGSVNCVRFHPNDPKLFCSVGGDGLVHLVKLPAAAESEEKRRSSSDSAEDFLSPDKLDDEGRDSEKRPGHKRASSLQEQVGSEVPVNLDTPLVSISGHVAPVSACTWMGEGQDFVTGSWDAVCVCWTVAEGDVIKNEILKGHHGRITSLDSQISTKLVLSACTDHTFRLCVGDLRSSPGSVVVFQGHTGVVNSAVFSPAVDQERMIATSSDDRTVQLWDMRKPSKPFVEIACTLAANHLSISKEGLIAAPLDDASVRVFDTAGNLVGFADHDSPGPKIMMTECAWSCDSKTMFSSSFDKCIYSWGLSGVDTLQQG